MKVKIKSSDGLKKLAQAAKGLRAEVVAGVLSGATNDESGEKVAGYARMIEYGTARMPARPFLRQTASESEDEWRKQIRHGLKARGLDHAEEVLGAVGRLMRSDIMATIRRGDFEPLAESTVKAKKRKGRAEPTAPLIDTTSLIRSIGSEVRK